MITIVDAIKSVLADQPQGLTSTEIYDRILERGLYHFNAMSPQAIVNGMIRRHCVDLDFPTASPHKYFKIVSNSNKKCKYGLFDDSEPNVPERINQASNRKINDGEQLPEEELEKHYAEHIKSLKMQLLNNILNASPRFFEELVLELLVKMGYGYDESAGIVTRYSKDGGVDGIIEEDRLGLDLIYIQAKRYSLNNKVGKYEVQQFAATMGEKNVKKGVFITTSEYGRDVKKKYSEPVDGKNIKLINGDELMELMIRYEVGVKSTRMYKTYIVDENYFLSQ